MSSPQESLPRSTTASEPRASGPTQRRWLNRSTATRRISSALEWRYMRYRSELESRIAKKTTKAIVDYQMIEDGDRVMVGLSGGKDSWALLQVLDLLRQRAPIT